jgi:3-oxoacyl-[acyl-carrier protein] reductase
MKVDLMNRIAVVTGAADGIGRSIALALAQNGATVLVNDVKDASQTCEMIRADGGSARFDKADVSSSQDVDAMIQSVEAEVGPIDILVNNAGVNVGKNRMPVHEFPDSEWRRILSVDLDGVFYCSRAVSTRMVSRRRGAIVNISSVLGIVPARLQCAFTAAKAGVINFTRSHALEVGQHGIRVNAIAPGSILTEGTKSLFYSPETKQKADSMLSHIPLGRPGDTEDIAAAALYLVSDDAKYVTGHTFVVDGGWTAVFSRVW